MSSASNLVINSNVNASIPRQAKRKRLLKACAPCNKSKRRCDGTAPCQNCTFAGKHCIYLDSSGREVPPPNLQPQSPTTSEATSSTSASMLPRPTSSANSVDPRIRSDRTLPPLPYAYQPPHPQPYSSYLSTFPPPRSLNAISDPMPTNAFVAKLNMGIEPIVVRDLVNIFFAHVHPHNTMFHRPTFLSHLGLGRVPAYLLNAVLALAAPSLPSLRADPNESKWHAGERFAQQAIKELFDENGALKYNPATRAGDELEVAQALVCLALHEAVMRRPSHDRSKYYTMATDILVNLGVPDWDVGEEPPPTYALSRAPFASFESSCDYLTTWRRRECLRRTLWVLHFSNMLATAFSELSVKYKELDVRLYLPVDEGVFDMLIPDDTIPEYLTIPKDGRPSRIYISEIGHLLRVTSVYSQMVGFAAESLPHRLRKLDNSALKRWRNTSEATIRSHETSLTNWEASLPSRLRLTDDNVEMHMSNLDYGVSNGAWAYIYMHALAKCGLLALYGISDVSLDADAVGRRVAKSVRLFDEFIYILKSFGVRGRSSIYMATLLFHIGNYQAAHREPNDPSRVHDEIVDQFFREYEANWGVSSAELLQVSFRTAWVMPILDAPPPSSPTGNGFSGTYSHPILGISSLNMSVARAPYHVQDARFSDRPGNLREDRGNHSVSYLDGIGVVSEERSTAGGSMTSSSSSSWAASPRT